MPDGEGSGESNPEKRIAPVAEFQAAFEAANARLVEMVPTAASVVELVENLSRQLGDMGGDLEAAYLNKKWQTLLHLLDKTQIPRLLSEYLTERAEAYREAMRPKPDGHQPF